MTWSRLSDDFTDRADLAGFEFADRWHYLALIQLCSRSGRLDGHLRRVDALRASDHPEPLAALSRLTTGGLIEIRGDVVVVSQIADHIPPPSVRAKSTTRTQRHRKHTTGDHSMCLSANCDEAPDQPEGTGETRSETRSGTVPPRTGQDGPGQPRTYARAGAGAREEEPVTEWQTTRIPEGEDLCAECRVCGQQLWHPESQKTCVCGKTDDAHRRARIAV